MKISFVWKNPYVINNIVNIVQLSINDLIWLKYSIV